MIKHLQIDGLWSKIYEPDGEIKQVVIGVHGFAGDKESSVLIALAEMLEKMNIALVTYDLPFHGENISNEAIDLNSCIESVGKVLEYVKRTYAEKPISFFSTSFGAYLTLNYLSKHNEKLNKVILRAPAIFMADTLKDVILAEREKTVEDLKKQPLTLGYEAPLVVNYKFLTDLQEQNLMNMPTTQNYLYVLQGKLDTTVNPINNAKFFNSNYKDNYEMFYFENADHRFKKPGELERILEITKNILNS